MNISKTKCIEIDVIEVDLKKFINQLYLFGLDEILDSIWQLENIDAGVGKFVYKVENIQSEDGLYINGKIFFKSFVESEEEFNTVFFINLEHKIRFGIFDSSFIFYCSEDEVFLNKLDSLYYNVKYSSNIPDYLNIECEKK